jgi:hypothetical protein
MNEEQVTKLFAELTEIKKISFATSDQVTIVDKRLSVLEQKIGVIDSRLGLIEQRLMNIEAWVPVDHRHLQHA